MKIFSLSNNKCESEKENIPLRSHRIVQLTDGTAAEITRVFVFCFTVLYLIVQCIEIRILDNGFTAQRQFPFERNPMRYILKYLRIVGNNFSNIAIAPSHRLDQFSVIIS